MFRIGEKVVCVEGSSTYPLIKGQIYTISGMGKFGRSVLVDVAEVQTDAKHAWYQHRFRPVVQRKTDISVLEALLVPGAKILDGVNA